MKKGLTKEEAIRRHRMMWEWIADETLKRKECVTETEALDFFLVGILVLYFLMNGVANMLTVFAIIAPLHGLVKIYI